MGVRGDPVEGTWVGGGYKVRVLKLCSSQGLISWGDGRDTTIMTTWDLLVGTA